MKVTYDSKADAMYIKILNRKVVRTGVVKYCTVNVDFDKNNNIVGIEFLFKEE